MSIITKVTSHPSAWFLVIISEFNLIQIEQAENIFVCDFQKCDGILKQEKINQFYL